jgi:ribose transport system permease protein
MSGLDTARIATSPDERRTRRPRIGSDAWTVIGLFAVTIVMILASRLISPSFGSWDQARAILVLTSFVMVIAFGQQSVILLGGLDLSVGSMMTLGGILTFSWIGGSGSALIWGIPAVLLVTGLVGAVNGLGVTFFRVPPFIMTLAIGTSPEAAAIAGMPVRRIVILTYAISGAAAGLAGILMVGYSGGATLTMGDSYLLPSIAAVVIGGTSIVGGRGLYAGAIAGAFLLTTLSTVISSIGIAQGWRTIIYGLVILVALVLLREELSLWFLRLRSRGGR